MAGPDSVSDLHACLWFQLGHGVAIGRDHRTVFGGACGQEKGGARIRKIDFTFVGYIACLSR